MGRRYFAEHARPVLVKYCERPQVARLDVRDYFANPCNRGIGVPSDDRYERRRGTTEWQVRDARSRALLHQQDVEVPYGPDSGVRHDDAAWISLGGGHELLECAPRRLGTDH